MWKLLDSRAMASTLVRVVLRPADLPQLFPGLPTRNTNFRWHLALCPKKCKWRHFFTTVSSFQSIATNDMTHICKLLYVNIMFDDLCHQTQKYSDGQRISTSFAFIFWSTWFMCFTDASLDSMVQHIIGIFLSFAIRSGWKSRSRENVKVLRMRVQENGPRVLPAPLQL